MTAVRTSLVIVLAAGVVGYAAFQLNQRLRAHAASAPTAAALAAADDDASGATPSGEQAPSASSRQQRAESEQLRREVANLSVQVAALSAPKTQTESSTSPDPMGPEAQAKFGEERRVYMKSVEKRFRDDSRDPIWSSAAHGAILAALDATKLRDAADSVECRSQMCRVEIADKGPETTTQMPLVALHLVETLPKIEYERIDDGHGHQSTVLYMSRYDDPAPAATPR